MVIVPIIILVLAIYIGEKVYRRRHTVKVNAELLSVKQGYEGGSSGVYRYFYNGEEYVVKIDLTKDKPDNALAGFAEFKASLRYEGIAPHTEWPKERVLLIDPNNPSSAVKNYEDKRRRDREETKANLIVLVIFIAIFAAFYYYGYTHRLFCT